MPLEPHQLLALVDAAEPLDPFRRSLALWQAVEAERPLDELWHAPVGCRDRALLELRAAEVGRLLELTDRCPRCAEEAEFSVDVTALYLSIPALENPPFRVEAGGRALTVRHVSTADLAAVAANPQEDLLARCLLGDGSEEGGTERITLPLTAEERAAVDAALAAGDPQADLSFELACPACREPWSTWFDIGEVLWTELLRGARRLLTEVDVLARTYHWSEREILQMPEGRRRRYLDLVVQ